MHYARQYGWKLVRHRNMHIFLNSSKSQSGKMNSNNKINSKTSLGIAVIAMDKREGVECIGGCLQLGMLKRGL